ncbi:MAG TPA: LysM peptidoglycan-binding domain-containing protein [Rhodocyclaceae bacterium]|nr:LysM peptidoglycan-binding domain-containing protein [Rhodocyclaceae bacterium]
MSKRILALLLFALALPPSQAAPPAMELAGDAPDSHTVRRGDTLWGIAGMFLKQPWRWPEIWRLNREQIANPHRIYPGQVVILDRDAEGGPRLKLGQPLKLQPKVYDQPLEQAIPSIPQQAIEPFLTRPMVVDAQFNEAAPKIIATDENRVYLGPGDKAYVTGLKQSFKRWQVYRPAKPIKDPDSGEILGHEAEHLGDATLVREGEPATLQIVRATMEIGKGDRLLPAEAPTIISYVPHAPEQPIEGRVIGLQSGVAMAGRHSVVMLNRGKKDGLEAGHVLALYRSGPAVNLREGQVVSTYNLPDERYGLTFVFRVFERVAYALVMNSERPVVMLDRVRTP